MTDETETDTPADGGVIHVARWERGLGRILSPFEEFLHRQTSAGMLLMGMAVLALILANGSFAADYAAVLKTYVGVTFGDWSLKMSLHHWINDALMAVFFFVVGLELKREFLVGELANPRNAALPIVAAIGGMVAPALLYLAINPTGDAAAGWGVPMATDIAFAVGAMALLGARAPKALVTFLVALAIVDDLGAVLVIAVFYTESIALTPLALTAALFAALVALNLSGVRSSIPYFIVSVALWYAMLQSGVHATLAGVLGALAVPAVPRYDPVRFSARMRELTGAFDRARATGGAVITNIDMRAHVQAMDNSVKRVQAPLQRQEHFWHLPVAFLVIPIFALANAGIPIELGAIGDTLRDPVFLGVSLGLIVGKFVGIVGACWLALKLGVASMPRDTSFSQIAGASLLAGIGFTMSIFVAQLAFGGREDLLLMAKTGILVASLLAGVTGFVWLYIAGRPRGG